MERKRIQPGPRVVVAARIRQDARERLVASLRDGERLSDRIRAILERAALRAA